MHDDLWIHRDRAAMTSPFMLLRRRPATEGERFALLRPSRLPPLRPPESREADGRAGRRQ